MSRTKKMNKKIDAYLRWLVDQPESGNDNGAVAVAAIKNAQNQKGRKA